MKKTLIYIVVGVAIVLAVAFIVGSSAGNTPDGKTRSPFGADTFPVPSVSSVPSAPQAAPSSLGKVPDLSFKDYAGKTVRLADFAGTPLVLNAWAAWCPFCKEELKDFAAAQKEFSAKGGSASGGAARIGKRLRSALRSKIS